ncbi:hypothetical protein A2318_01040 [Candidatus Uhrbacteria bacterium RIFOXYB2_FULL_45_11]|uniref:Uncharacterized protein n=1 Tax=Candidatus Uhrbacteria bacterium RIFOXYB2_FULL_45_11 TaxID=1802421 RepID=A0A1F7W979_9BACT|nr:MAG: hypothetical protein A2318_01040 [Candidatus Uhrbacteria bacterium RIFOXYB2_FULL_45_11]
MTTKALESKVQSLTREVKHLRSVVYDLASQKDSEGEYKAAFVKKTIALQMKKGKIRTFTTKENFLKQIQSKRV